ncbi:MAG: TlpA family protein disulfide reductase [Chitinophagaceae bacterium]|nr:MAG: TlpA family protein disulfide reductase [Chitinophagaceae bacterium]
MRYILFVSALLLTMFNSVDGNTQDAAKIFKQVADALTKLSFLQYDSYREINNYKDNYFAKNSGTSYLDFASGADGKALRLQLRSEKSLQVYNGTEFFQLNESDKSSVFSKKDLRSLENLSLLYNSIPTLRVSLPLIAGDAGIPKSVKDTSIEGRTYYLLKFELSRKTLAFPSGFSDLDAEVTRYYDLVVNKKTLLPYIIIDRNSIMKDQYYTKTIFTNIETQPGSPSPASWFFSSYTGYSPKQDLKRKSLVEVGTNLPSWILPEYKGSMTDSVDYAAFKGKKVLMEFWIKNCGYCMEAFPEMKTLQEKYGKQVDILSVNAYDDRKEIAFFYERDKPGYRMLYNGEKLANDLGIYAFPVVVILDESGKVIYSHEGFNKEQIEKVLEK